MKPQTGLGSVICFSFLHDTNVRHANVRHANVRHALPWLCTSQQAALFLYFLFRFISQIVFTVQRKRHLVRLRGWTSKLPNFQPPNQPHHDTNLIPYDFTLPCTKPSSLQHPCDHHQLQITTPTTSACFGSWPWQHAPHHDNGCSATLGVFICSKTRAKLLVRYEVLIDDCNDVTMT